MNQNFMKEKPVMPLVISMALPMTFSMLVNALYNIIDSYFVARISEDAMTALSLVFPLQNLVNAVVIGFAIGINATIAYFLGAQKQNTADKAASLGTLFNMIHGLILAVVCSETWARHMRRSYFFLQYPMRQVFVLKRFFSRQGA